jgi:regulator of extracellular matrix RemA (YlzA/DUF370 family)
MYVNIGWEEYLKFSDIIAVLKKSSVDLNLKEKGKRIRFDKETKTFILTDDKLYKVSIRSETIANRVNSKHGGVND